MRFGHQRPFLAGTLVAAIIVTGTPEVRTQVLGEFTSQALARNARPSALLASDKPDWRGVDTTNSGVLNTAGPVTLPSQVFDVHPSNFGTTTGIDLDAQHNVIFSTYAGSLFSYTPAGSQNWKATTGGTGADVTCTPSNPVLGTDGAVYEGADNGNLFQVVPSLATGAPPVAPSGAIFSDSAPGAGISQTPKLGPDGTIYAGDSGGSFYALTPPAPPANASSSFGTATVKYTFSATGSTQTVGTYSGTTSSPPFKFCGEAALDSSTGIVYVASSDTNPANGNSLSLGTLYAINSDGGLKWKMPLQGSVLGAVVFDASKNAVIVGDSGREVVAFNRSTGVQLWAFGSPNGNGFVGSPALSSDGNTVYVAENQGVLRALNVADGTLAATFGTNGVVPIDNGSGAVSSPIVDKNGDIYLVGNAGTAYGISPGGTLLWNIPAGIGAGQVGNNAAKYMSPAIAGDGSIYFAGINARVRGFQAPPSGVTFTPTNTPTITSTPTVSPTAQDTATDAPTGTPTNSPTPTSTLPPDAATFTTTATPSQTMTPSATPTQTPSATPTNTYTNTPTPTFTSTPTQTPTMTVTTTGTPAPTVGPGAGWSKYGGNLHNDGGTSVQLNLSGAPGPRFAIKLVNTNYPPNLRTSPALNADGTVLYEPDNQGHLVAVNASDGSIKWTSGDVLGTAQSTLKNIDLGSSPAVASDGAIYVGSEASGIYKFAPADGSNTKFFGSGTYQGSSVVLGPGGIVYGGSIDGTIYAAKPDGSQNYAFKITDCPGGYNPYIENTPALDKQGNLYLGYGCSAGGNAAARGGVVSLDASGAKRWNYAVPPPVNSAGATPSQVYGAVVLSPDEKSLYLASPNALFALHSSDGSKAWEYDSTSLMRSSPALSPDGGTLYESLTAAGSAAGAADSYALIALRTGDGGLAKGVGLGDNPQPDLNGGFASPAVDSSGNVLFAFTDGMFQGYSAGLNSQLFSETVNNQAGAQIYGGPVVSTDGSIYLANAKGYLVAVKAGVVVPTPVPTNTLVPNVTHSAPTDTPVASIPTFTPSPSPLPGTTYSPTPTPKGSSGSGSGGGSSSTTTSNFFNQGSGGTTGSTAKPGAKSTSKPGSTKGVTSGKPQDLVIHIAAGTLGVGNMSVLHLTTKPGAKINYTVKTSYTFPAKPKTTAKKQTPPSKKKQGISTTSMARGIVPSTAANPGPYARVAAFSPAAEADDNAPPASTYSFNSVPAAASSESPLHASALGRTPDAPVGALASRAFAAAATATPTGSGFFGAKSAPTVTPKPTPKPSTKAKPAATKTKPKPSAKPVVKKPTTKPAAKPAAPVCPKGAAMLVIAANGTFRVAHTADKHGDDAFCLRISKVPGGASGLHVALQAQVTVAHAKPISKSFTFEVLKVQIVPATLKPRLSIVVPTLRKGAMQTVRVVAAARATLSYEVSYGKGTPTVRFSGAADAHGNAKLQFRIGYGPKKGASVKAVVTVKANQPGRSQSTASANFTVKG